MRASTLEVVLIGGLLVLLCGASAPDCSKSCGSANWWVLIPSSDTWIECQKREGTTGSTPADGSGGAAAGAGGGGGASECITKADCKEKPTSLCQEVTCSPEGQCVTQDLPEAPAPSQVYGDCKTRMCDGHGQLAAERAEPKDVYVGNPCKSYECQMDGHRNDSYLPEGTACALSTSNEGICDGAGNCRPPTWKGAGTSPFCGNGAQDNGETDKDCGGPQCIPCVNGKTCTADTDCESLSCTVVELHCTLPSCFNKRRDGMETDVDCGGPCATMGGACADGRGCMEPGDCKSGVCKGGTCLEATCKDGVKNGLETSVDCGVGCPTDCPDLTRRLP